MQNQRYVCHQRVSRSSLTLCLKRAHFIIRGFSYFKHRDEFEIDFGLLIVHWLIYSFEVDRLDGKMELKN